MQTLRVAMLGGPGVGKTSLLAGMYDQFISNKLVGASNLRLDADSETSARLDERLKELKHWETDLGKTEGGPNPTDELRRFSFTLGERERSDSLRLQFVDYPGSWITKQIQKVMGILKQSSVALVPIDAPALMEATGDWSHLHEVINKPRLIKDIFVELFGQVRHPFLVLFVPLRCERYVQNPAEAQRLVQKVREGYAEAFEFFQNKSHLSRLAVVITPVQTLGSIVFSRLVSRNDDQKEPTPPDDYAFHFEKVSPNASVRACRYRPTPPLCTQLRAQRASRIQEKQAAV